MPLRAKILRHNFQTTAPASTPMNNEIRPLSSDDPDDVIFDSIYGLRSIQLNRPKKLNSLNASMIRKIVPRLIEWEKSDMANVVVMKGAGQKAFCAGGDVTSLAEANADGPDGWKRSAEYFGMEYMLDHYIATYQKPYVAFMDGITMGGGVGLSTHAPFRIATEKTVYAMPETTIGFFPDVGASFALPRMNGSVGTYLALTSDRLSGPNVFYSGVATHYLHSTSLPSLEARLAELRFKDYDSMETRLNLVNDAIEEFCTGLPHDQPIHLAGELRNAIDRCFSLNRVDDILRALEKEEGATKAWAEKTLDTLHKRSPTSVHVTLRQMRIGRAWSIAETFKREHAIASKFMQTADFREGVTALLVRKEKPNWTPASLEDISADASAPLVEPFFKFTDEKLKLLVDRDYEEYPHAHFGVPTEEEIRKIADTGDKTRAQVSEIVLASRKNRQGIKQVVDEVLRRKTVVGADGMISWNP